MIRYLLILAFCMFAVSCAHAPKPVPPKDPDWHCLALEHPVAGKQMMCYATAVECAELYQQASEFAAMNPDLKVSECVAGDLKPSAAKK